MASEVLPASESIDVVPEEQNSEEMEQEEQDDALVVAQRDEKRRSRTGSTRSLMSTGSQTKKTLQTTLSGILRNPLRRKSSSAFQKKRESVKSLSGANTELQAEDEEEADETVQASEEKGQEGQEKEQGEDEEKEQEKEKEKEQEGQEKEQGEEEAGKEQLSKQKDQQPDGVAGFFVEIYNKVVGKPSGTNDPNNQIENNSNKTENATPQMNRSEIQSLNSIVSINVGGEVFATSLATLANGGSELLTNIIQSLSDDQADPIARDQEGRIFIDHDGRNFGTILNFLRANTPTSLPELESREWLELRADADFFGVRELAKQMDDLLAEEQARLDAIAKKKREKRRSSTTDLLQKQGRELERMRVELHKLQFEKAKAEAEGRPMFEKMEFAYNLMAVGCTGSGKSSVLNTILDDQVCLVSGAQAQGTRGCTLRDGVIDNKHFISYLDTQGLGADTSISDEELLEQIMLSAESIRQMGIINNILISFDLATRTTPASIANNLTLCELFHELRRSCFIAFTKVNTNSVMSEWNHPLKKWVKKHRKIKSIEKITQEPPSYQEMYRAYCKYLLSSVGANKEDGGAFAKLVTLLSFFESRVLFMYNLDPVGWEDKEDGDLSPYEEYLYTYYRKKALITLKRGSTMIKTEDLAFLKNDEDTIADVAGRLVEHRDEKIQSLELAGTQPEKLKRLRSVFTTMYGQAATDMNSKRFDIHEQYTTELFQLLDRPHKSADVGCLVM